jgi:uncharacterized protein (TIGR02996 family)
MVIVRPRCSSCNAGNEVLAAKYHTEAGFAEPDISIGVRDGSFLVIASDQKAPSIRRRDVLAILDSIKDHPEDDTPRLVLADWLEEYGDEADVIRGQFIRLECMLATMPANTPGRDELNREAAAIWDLYSPIWLGPARARVIVGALQRGQRGLLHLRADARSLTGKEGALLAETEAFAWVDRLELTAGKGSTLALLAGKPLLHRLNGLGLRNLQLGEAGIRALAEQPKLSCLTWLDLTGNDLGQKGVKLVGEAPLLANVRFLDLSSNRLGNSGLYELARSPRLQHLKHLSLVRTDLKDSVAHLADASWMSGVESLDLSGSGITDAGVVSLVKTPAVRNLVRLDLKSNSLTDVALEAIASSPYLESLAELDVGACRVGLLGYGARAIGRQGLKALADSPLFGRLRRLGLRELGGSYGGARAWVAQMLVRSPYWGRLQCLELDQVTLGDEGATLLAEALGAESLRYLSVPWCRIGEVGIRALANALERGRIGKVHLYYNGISEQLWQELKARFGERLQPRPA